MPADWTHIILSITSALAKTGYGDGEDPRSGLLSAPLHRHGVHDLLEQTLSEEDQIPSISIADLWIDYIRRTVELASRPGVIHSERRAKTLGCL